MCLEERNTERRARPLAALMAPRTRALRRCACFLESAMAGVLLLLAFFAEDELARIFHTLALVGFGPAERTDLRRHLPDLLLVDTGDDDLGRLRRRDSDALRDRKDDVVTVAERDLQVLALHRRAIADAADLELGLETLGDAGDQIGDQRPRRPPHGAPAVGLTARIDLDGAVLHLDDDLVRQHDLQGALRPLHLHRLALDRSGDARRDGDRSFADA